MQVSNMILLKLVAIKNGVPAKLWKVWLYFKDVSLYLYDCSVVMDNFNCDNKIWN